MENKFTEEQRSFLDDISEIFEKHPDMKTEYSLSSRRLLNRLLANKSDDQVIVKRWEGGRIVIGLEDKSNRKAVWGCCEYCQDPDGNDYCCVTGPDC